MKFSERQIQRGVVLILLLAMILLVVFWLNNRSSRVGPEYETSGGAGGTSLICQTNATPTGTCTAINAAAGLQSNNSSGVFTLSVITPTLVPTATPQPTATPGAGGSSDCLLSSDLPIPSGSNVSNTAYLGVPGVSWVGNGSGFVVANDIYYEPFNVCREITVNQLAFIVTSAGNPGDYCRVGIYESNALWQPGSLVVDGGQVANNTTGWKFATINNVLTPGPYLSAIICNTGPGLGSAAGASYLTSNINTGTTSSTRYAANIRATSPSGTPAGSGFASMGDAWDTIDLNTGPFYHFVLMRFSEN